VLGVKEAEVKTRGDVDEVHEEQGDVEEAVHRDRRSGKTFILSKKVD
jgi:hypothetical protein